MGMKDNWETKANKPDVETTGGEKPVGKQKNNKKTKMWRPMGVKSHWGNKKSIIIKYGYQWELKNHLEKKKK